MSEVLKPSMRLQEATYVSTRNLMQLCLALDTPISGEMTVSLQDCYMRLAETAAKLRRQYRRVADGRRQG